MSALFARRHLALRLLLAGLALAAGAAFYFASRPVFSSRALVRLGAGATLDHARAVAKELTQPQLLERTASRLGVKVPASELAKSYLFQISAEPVSHTGIAVGVRAYSKEWAEHWAETLVAECVDFRRIRQRKETADAIRALNREMAEIAEKFGNAGGRKFDATDKAGLARQLAEIHDLRNPAREIEPLAKRIDALSRVHADLLNPEISMVEKLTLIAAVEQAAGTGQAGSVPAWESIEERRRPLMDLLAMLEFASLAPDVAVLALRDEIEEIDRKLQAEFDTDFSRFDVDYRNLVDRKAALEEKAAQPAGPSDAAIDLRLRHLAQRIEGPGGDASSGGDPAYAGMQQISDRPVSPDLLKIALVSLLGGGALAMGVPLLVERSGFGRAKVARLEARIGLPAIGCVPAISNPSPGLPVLADMEDERFAPFAECFRNLRASLLADSAAPRALMITSAIPGEGKTTVAANLAVAFAESGVRTLVIDTDMRRGRLHRLFGYRPAPGLGNVLAGEIAAEKAIRPTPRENLYVLNAGTAPGPGDDPLASERFAKVIAQLRESLDLLIFDAPPVLGLPATATLAPHTDAALIVVSPAQSRAAAEAVVLLRASGVKVRGFVPNRAQE